MPASHDAAVNSLKELYELLIQMEYLPKDLVQMPPHKTVDDEDDDTALNVKACTDVGFNEDVIKLMQQLPYFMGDSDDWFIAPYTHPVSYLKDWRIDQGRDPLDVGRTDVPPHAFALTWGALYGTYLIYDTESGNITDWIADSGEEETEAQEQKEGYAHLPTRPANDVLQEWINRYKTLQWLPVFKNGQASIVALVDEDTSVYEKLKKAYVDCGWPNNFKGEEFVEKRKKWEETDLKDYINQMEEDRKKAMEEPEEE